jgi:hypothetical protein
VRDPELVVGDGAMALWKALVEVFPGARRQQCWVRKARNITNALPKSGQPSRAFLQAVNVGSIRAHRASERSLGYGFRWLTSQRDRERDGRSGSTDHWAVLVYLYVRRTSRIEAERNGRAGLEVWKW